MPCVRKSAIPYLLPFIISILSLPLSAAPSYDQIAAFISGMDIDSASPFFAATASGDWKKYHAVTDSAWNSFNRNKTDKIVAWAKAELPPSVQPIKTLFYPFSGPDFVFAYSFFPAAHRYVFFGMEPVGKIPDPFKVRKDSLGLFYRTLDNAIEESLSFSFFKTKDMKTELANQFAPGTLPILMLFLARTGNHIVDIKPFTFDTTGALRYSAGFTDCTGENCYNSGCEIAFQKDSASDVQTVIYFSVDISDKGLSKNSGCTNALAALDTGITTYIKSASYLMHRNSFSLIRETILKKSSVILQDDSGIPYAFFKKSLWNIQLFGTYTGPIALFNLAPQENLLAAYERGAKKLNIRLGYAKQSNLLLAKRK